MSEAGINNLSGIKVMVIDDSNTIRKSAELAIRYQLANKDALIAAAAREGQPEYRLMDALGLPGQRALAAHR